jgi:hypothetical protein
MCVYIYIVFWLLHAQVSKGCLSNSFGKRFEASVVFYMMHVYSSILHNLRGLSVKQMKDKVKNNKSKGTIIYICICNLSPDIYISDWAGSGFI